MALNGERPELGEALAEDLGEEYVVLMDACWAMEPSMRPTFEQVR